METEWNGGEGKNKRARTELYFLGTTTGNTYVPLVGGYSHWPYLGTRCSVLLQFIDNDKQQHRHCMHHSFPKKRHIPRRG